MLGILLLKSPSFAAFLGGNDSQEMDQLIDAPFIDQRDKYPTGCESVTAVMALQYAGVDISVEEFIDLYLPQGNAPHYDELGNYVGANPWKEFLGSPYSEQGWGCYAPVIVNAIEQVLQDRNVSNLEVKELEGQETFHSLPGVCGKRDPGDSVGHHRYGGTHTLVPQFQLEGGTGEMFTWIYPLHCLLLIGEDQDSYYFNDPLAGEKVPYDKDQVEIAYQGVGMQAVVVE